MRHAARLMASVILALLAASCAATRAAPEAVSVYEVDLGRSSFETIVQQVPRILNRYRFPLLRGENRETTIYFETEWKPRDPFEDESALGFAEASTRIIIEARRSGATLWRVRFTAENRLRRPTSREWEVPPLTEMFSEYMARIVQELERDLQMRIR